MTTYKFFITGHKGFETLLFQELRSLLDHTPARLRKRYGGVEVESDLASAYRVCLHSRLANRAFLELSEFRARDEDELYQGVNRVNWSEHLSADASLAISATVSRSSLDHDRFVALKTKDAIVDQFRQFCGRRPNIERHKPDLQLHLHLHKNRAQLSIDLSGESLHRRGYRLEHSGAPLKEHLAVAMLIQAGWRGGHKGPARLLDPMCGSGTFAIEAAMMVIGQAPGLIRNYYGFAGWRGHQADMWQELVASAKAQIRIPDEVCVFASDHDTSAIEIARDNARRAGVLEYIEFSHRQVSDCSLSPSEQQTLVVANPPYEKRLQTDRGLDQLYADLGDCVSRLESARLAIISANPKSMHRLRLTRSSRKEVRNGPLDCVFAIYNAKEKESKSVSVSAMPESDEAGLHLRNRLVKNNRHLQRWARRNGISCYRVYDADLPEFSFALDRYQSDIDSQVEWFHLQEYQAPASIDIDKAARRVQIARQVVMSLYEIPEDRLYCKLRSRQRGSKQYQAQAQQRELFQVSEADAKLLVNLSDYLDTGLFLDHRITRDRICQLARDKTLLNLFCYTGSVGVRAGLGGARSVTNVDLSANYLHWAEENHRLNQLQDESRYRYVRADVMHLLENPGAYPLETRYDLIFLDPPSFSNSSKMSRTLDVQRDHVWLVESAMRLLGADGLLIFSCNRRKFRLDDKLSELFRVDDVSAATIPEDFKRSPSIHHCWEIRHRD